MGSETAWSASQLYDRGYNPTVAVDQNQAGSLTSATVIEVHQSGVNSSELWYHLGTLTFSGSTVTVTWGPAHDTGLSGYAPTVSVYNGLAVIVAEGSAAELWYSLAVVNPGAETTQWGAPIPYDKRYNPTVSIQNCGFSPFGCDWLVVEAHQEDKGTGPLWYRVGIMLDNGGEPTSIAWTPNAPVKYISSGCYPSVSQLTNALGVNNEVVESHSDACEASANIVSSFGIFNLQ